MGAFSVRAAVLINGKKVVLVMPAYNASKTLGLTYDEIPKEYVDDILLVDDGSSDDTVGIARRLGIRTLLHDRNKGYGANQKTCYKTALEMGGDIIVMLHPDYQYSPKVVPAIVTLLAYGPYDAVFGSRVLVGGALEGGMPLYKYAFNRVLTFVQNVAWRSKLSEFHTGMRSFKRYTLESIDFEANSDDFVFDNQIIAQLLWNGYKIGEVSCPVIYFPHASSISFRKGLKYGVGVLKTTLDLLAAKSGLYLSGYLKSASLQKDLSKTEVLSTRAK
jgi:glycosyltransferase involved in cell wall biosynthesis